MRLIPISGVERARWKRERHGLEYGVTQEVFLLLVKNFLDLARPFTLLAPAVGILAASATADGEFHSIALLCALAAALLNGAANATNQCFDVEIDRINKPGRPLPSGRIGLRLAAMFSALLYAGALSLSFCVNRDVFLIFLFTAALTFLYSAPPFRFKKHVLTANLTLAITRGCLLIVAGWACVRPVWSPTPWFIGLVFGLYLLGAASTKDFADIRGDRAFGIRTLPILAGVRRSAFLISPCLVLPFLLIPLGVSWGWLTAAVLPLTSLSIWGLYIAYLIVRRPEALTLEANHVSWKHMYLLLMAGQVGFAVAYMV